MPLVYMPRLDELYHHGIQGMHWGKRNGPPYPLDYKSHSTEEKRQNTKSKLSAYTDSKGNQSLRKYKKLQKKWAKQDSKDDKIYNKIKLSKREKSKYRLKYEQEYLKKGMTKKESEIAAYKKERAIKIASAAAVVTVVAATAYVASRHYDKNVDRFLKSGVELKRVTDSADLSVHDGFYAVLGKNKLDATKYAGSYANEKGGLVSDIYQKTINVGSSGIKIASEKSGANALNRIMNAMPKNFDRDLENDFRVAAETFRNAGKKKNAAICEKAIKSLQKGRIDNNVYEAAISAHGPLGGQLKNLDKTTDMLFNELKKAGYNGIQDINDKYFSGYHAKMPAIIFDAGSVKVSNVRLLTDGEIIKNVVKSTPDIFLSNNKSKIIAAGAAYAAGKGITTISKNNRNDRIVANYRKEHPNTDLSYNEIVRNYLSNN